MPSKDKPQPPDNTNEILSDIRTSNAAILLTAKDQLSVAKQQLSTEQSQLTVSHAVLDTLKEILIAVTPPPHAYKLEIKELNKEKKTMAVQGAVASAFKVVMQDNGNPITPPDGTVYKWSTEDPTDLIEEKSIDGSASIVSITVTGDDPNRTTMTVTVKGNDPDGNEISGELTVDVVPGTTHVFTLIIQQVVDPSINPLRAGKAKK